MDLCFKCIEDFEPANVATQIAPLNTLLKARQQLASLLIAMDGKDEAEELLAKLLHFPDLLHSIVVSHELSAERLMIEGYRLSTLLEEAFEPRTDQAQQAVERAVRPLAEQALVYAHILSGRMSPNRLGP